MPASLEGIGGRFCCGRGMFLKRDYPNKFDILLDAYKQLFPSISKISIKAVKISAESNITEDVPYVVTDRIYRLVVIDNNLYQIF